MRPTPVLALLCAAQFAGCASIVNGQNQSITVEARAEAGAIIGATCKLVNNKGEWFVTTPGSTTVHRSYEDLSVRCDKDALAPGMVTVKSSTKGMAFGNILFGGVIGAGVDMSTGAAYDYPTSIMVVMSASTPSAAVGTTGSSMSPVPAPVTTSSPEKATQPASSAASGAAT